MAEQKTVSRVIAGMTCNYCVMATKKSLASLPGVARGYRRVTAAGPGREQPRGW